MRQLVDETGETAYISGWRNGGVEVLGSATRPPRDHGLRPADRVGRATRTRARRARLLLAHLPEAPRDARSWPASRSSGGRRARSWTQRDLEREFADHPPPGLRDRPRGVPARRLLHRGPGRRRALPVRDRPLGAEGPLPGELRRLPPRRAGRRPPTDRLIARARPRERRSDVCANTGAPSSPFRHERKLPKVEPARPYRLVRRFATDSGNGCRRPVGDRLRDRRISAPSRRLLRSCPAPTAEPDATDVPRDRSGSWASRPATRSSTW